MRTTVFEKLQEQQNLLRSLGKPRETLAQQQAYLRDIVKTYEDLSIKSLRAPAEMPSDDIKLRGRTQNMNANSAKMMLMEGHKLQFLEIGQEMEVDLALEDDDSGTESRRISVVSSSSA